MVNQHSNSRFTPQNGEQSIEKTTHSSIKSYKIMKSYEEELKDIYWDAKELCRAIAKMIRNETCQDRLSTLKCHLGNTADQITRLEQVFESIDQSGMERKWAAGDMDDEGNISARQKVDHCEMYLTERFGYL